MSDSDREYVLMPVHSIVGSERGGGRGRRGIDFDVEVNNFLGVPQARPRASSTGGPPAPTIVNIGALSDRGRSHSRHRDHHHHHHSRSCSSCSRSRSRSRRPSRPIFQEEDLPYNVRRELEYARRAHREDDERRILDRIRREREDDKKRWKLEDEAESIRRKKERDAIVLEAKLEEERKKKEAEDLRKKILAEEELRKQLEKDKKKAEEAEFERKVKEKFMNAGYSPEYIEEVLHRKKAERSTLAIDLQRPTFIKVHRKYLLPDTLDHYGLPWEWDSRDDEYIIIKKYIDHSLQDELFEHTRRIKERKLITGPYVKETKTITTLTPNDKRNDRIYLVRQKSKSPRRSSWFAT